MMSNCEASRKFYDDFKESHPWFFSSEQKSLDVFINLDEKEVLT